MTEPPEWTPPPAPAQPEWTPPQPPTAWEPPAPSISAPPARPARRGWLIAAAVAVLLAAGGVVSYIAVSDSSHHGAASPQAAVQAIVDDINNSDLLGVLNDLAPGERDAVVQPVTDIINQLKRTGVLQNSADPSKVAGVQFSLTHLTFSGTPVVVNDHVQIVEITGGTVHINADLAKAPLTKAFLDAAFPGGVPSNSTSDTTMDIAQHVKDNGKPERIAAQKVDGRWYPSLAYTIADSALNGQLPKASDAIPDQGAASAADAVREEINALLTGDFRLAIELLSPAELQAVHDYAGVILSAAPPNFRTPVQVQNITFAGAPISGGGQRETLSSMTLTSSSGDPISISVDGGGCASVDTAGNNQRICLADYIDNILSGAGVTHDITAPQRKALVDLFTSITSVGVDAVTVDGKWYVAPVRTSLDLISGMLSGLHDNDVAQLIGVFSGH